MTPKEIAGVSSPPILEDSLRLQSSSSRCLQGPFEVRGVKETGFKVGSYHLATQLCPPPLSEELKLPLKICREEDGGTTANPSGGIGGFCHLALSPPPRSRPTSKPRHCQPWPWATSTTMR